MFFWLIAIPFFVIIAMFTLFRLPSSDLNQPEEIQDAAMAFRMALQHDAAAKLMEDYKANGESTFFDLGSYNIEGDDWKVTLMESGYLPASFVSDTDNIVTYVRCLNSLREITSCRTATGVYIVTAAAAPSSSAITSRWFETAGAERLAEQLEKYSGSFPVKQDGLAIPVRPVKEEDESDEDFAIRLNAYKTAKSEYMRLKRRYYNFGEGMPRPDTTVGQVRAYPFYGGEEADERVIVRRIRSVEGGTVNYDLTQVPVDIPDTEGQPFDFNGEAVILTASFKRPSACVADSDCNPGYTCNAGVCEPATTCVTSNDCALGYYCNEGNCTQASFTCGTTDYIETDTWIQQWSACSRCPAGQFKKYKTLGETEENSDYPVAHNAGCVNIPALNSYTVMPAGLYSVDSGDNFLSMVNNANMWHRRVNITCNGNNEEWDVVGPFPNWWEAQEICAKLGKTLPVDHTVFFTSCNGETRTQVIKYAIAVGTGQTLEEINVMNGSYGWDSTTGNTTGSDHSVVLNSSFGADGVRTFEMTTDGFINGWPRSYSGFDTYVLCGPAQ